MTSRFSLPVLWAQQAAGKGVTGTGLPTQASPGQGWPFGWWRPISPASLTAEGISVTVLGDKSGPITRLYSLGKCLILNATALPLGAASFQQHSNLIVHEEMENFTHGGLPHTSSLGLVMHMMMWWWFILGIYLESKQEARSGRQRVGQIPLSISRFMCIFPSTGSGAPPPSTPAYPVQALPHWFAAAQSQPVHSVVSAGGGLGLYFPSRQNSV